MRQVGDEASRGEGASGCVRAHTCAHVHVPFPLGHSSNSVLTSFYKLTECPLHGNTKTYTGPKTHNSQMLTWPPKNRSFERCTRTSIHTVLKAYIQRQNS